MFDSIPVEARPYDADKVVTFSAMDTDNHAVYNLTCKASELKIKSTVGNFYFVEDASGQEFAVSKKDLEYYFEIKKVG